MTTTLHGPMCVCVQITKHNINPVIMCSFDKDLHHVSAWAMDYISLMDRLHSIVANRMFRHTQSL